MADQKRQLDALVLSMVPCLLRIFWEKLAVAQERASNSSVGSRPGNIGRLGLSNGVSACWGLFAIT